jgi:DnaJ family protein B protein 12
MDNANKEQAHRALELGKKCYREGNYVKALKYALTSNRLYASAEAVSLAQSASHRMTSQQQQQGRGDDSSASEESARVKPRSSAGGGESGSGSGSGGNGYTEEHVRYVRKIESCRTFYEILGVHSNSTPDDLKVLMIDCNVM